MRLNVRFAPLNTSETISAVLYVNMQVEFHDLTSVQVWIFSVAEFKVLMHCAFI